MKILSLAINVKDDDRRDKITYNFILKELNWLAAAGVEVFYLSDLPEHKSENGVMYLSKDKILESSTFIRRISNVMFLLRHLSFFLPMIRHSFSKTMRVCGVERACAKIIKKHKIDCIHSHFFEPFGESLVLASRRFRIPVVATLRGAELRAMPQFSYGARLDPFYDAALRKSLPYVHFITAPSRYLCSMLLELFGAQGSRIKYLPNGVEPISCRKTLPPPQEPITFIGVANMFPIKNFQLVFRALRHLSERFDFQAHFVGSGVILDTFREHLSTFKHVHVHREMPKTQLFPLMARCDFLVHPSYSEGMPNVVLEAQAMGLPCVLSDIDVHREIVIDGKNGYLFDPYKYDGFIEKMSLALSSRQMLWDMRELCMRAASSFTLEKKMLEMMEIYNALINTSYETLCDPAAIVDGIRKEYTYATT
ncbi:MAG: glycosyltransferase family 4 protein [Chitinivibrionales bacterium]